MQRDTAGTTPPAATRPVAAGNLARDRSALAPADGAFKGDRGAVSRSFRPRGVP
jgi:hypothetical protein